MEASPLALQPLPAGDRGRFLLAAAISLALMPGLTMAETVKITDITGREVEVRVPVERVILGEGRQIYFTAALDTDAPFKRVVGWRDDFKKADLDGYNIYLQKFPEMEKIPNIRSKTAKVMKNTGTVMRERFSDSRETWLRLASFSQSERSKPKRPVKRKKPMMILSQTVFRRERLLSAQRKKQHKAIMAIPPESIYGSAGITVTAAAPAMERIEPMVIYTVSCFPVSRFSAGESR